MSMKIQTALTSYGMSGAVFHGPSLKSNPNFEVKSVLERSKNLSNELFPEAAIVRNYTDILNDDTIDLVVVNTPDYLHYDMCKQALNAGKHVVVEKPFTQTVEQADELIALAKKKNLVLTVYQNRRLDGDFLTVKKIIEEGLLGRIVELESHYDRFRNFIQANTWKEEGIDRVGVLYNLGSHMVDQVICLFGLPKSVTAHLAALRTEGKVTDYYDIRLQYDGFAALLKSSYLVREPGPRYSLHGTLGSFQKWGIDPQEEALKAGAFPEGPEWGIEPESAWGIIHTEKNGEIIREKMETIPGNYGLFYDNVYRAITTGDELLVKPEESRDCLRILEACLLSNKEQRTIRL